MPFKCLLVWYVQNNWWTKCERRVRAQNLHSVEQNHRPTLACLNLCWNWTASRPSPSRQIDYNNSSGAAVRGKLGQERWKHLIMKIDLIISVRWVDSKAPLFSLAHSQHVKSLHYEICADTCSYFRVAATRAHASNALKLVSVWWTTRLMFADGDGRNKCSNFRCCPSDECGTKLFRVLLFSDVGTQEQYWLKVFSIGARKKPYP